jgi:hypothetical protein
LGRRVTLYEIDYYNNNSSTREAATMKNNNLVFLENPEENTGPLIRGARKSIAQAIQTAIVVLLSPH